MILTGDEIQKKIALGEIEISPFRDTNLGPNSYDITLDNKIKIYMNDELDAKAPNLTVDLHINDNGLLLLPGKLYLGQTKEMTWSDKYVPLLEGRSSMGRLGVSIHATAGFGDLGFRGNWTLEISCIQPVKIYPNMRVGQIYFLETKGWPGKLYNGKYQGQSEPMPSKINEDF